MCRAKRTDILPGPFSPFDLIYMRDAFGLELLEFTHERRIDKRTCWWLPPAMLRKSRPDALYTSMYRWPMWCLCRRRANSRCSIVPKRTNASPLRRPWLLRHRATPPLEERWTSFDQSSACLRDLLVTRASSGGWRATHFSMSRPRKNLATSWSVHCHGNPRARMTVFSSILSSNELDGETSACA